MTSTQFSHSSDQMRRQLDLQRAFLELASEPDIQRLIQQITDDSRQLLGARYGATCLWSEDGHRQALAISGMSKRQLDTLGEPPVDDGFGMVSKKKGPVYFADLKQPSEGAGFRQYCPKLRALLVVPMLDGTTIRGGIFLADKQPEWILSDDDLSIASKYGKRAALAIKNAELSEMAVSAAVALERRRIARELHDSLAQILAYISHKANAAVELIGIDNETATRHVSELGEVARDAYSEVRDTILGLRVMTERPGLFHQHLRTYLAMWEEQTGVRAELVLPLRADDLQLGPVAEVQVLRTVQEALANVRRHAGATEVIVAVHRLDNGEIELTVSDNGSGFDPATAASRYFSGFGLTTMRERALEMGGELEVTSRPGYGTRVRLKLPFNAQLPEHGN